MTDDQNASPPERSLENDSSTKQIRGSTLLLLGRVCSLVLNFIAQLIIIRHLTKQDYGAFAYAISLIELASLGAAFGMDKTFSQFGAVYHQQGNLPRLNGALIFSTGMIVGLGMLLVGGYWCGHHYFSQWMELEPSISSALFLLVFLIPAGAFGSLASSFFAVMGETKTVFFRRHLFGPIVKCVALLAAILLNGSFQAIALAFLISGLIQLLLDVILMVKFARKYELLDSLKRERPNMPIREFLGFSLPLLTSDAAFMIRGSMVVVLLAMLSGSLAAASFRAVQPVIKLSELPLITFGILFTPLAARLTTRNHPEQLREMYTRSRAWVRVLTFPIFAVCVLLAEPVIQTLFGKEYLDSAMVMVILSVGYYFQAALGFNSRLLKVLKRMKAVVITDVMGTLLTLGLCFLLIPRWQAVGASLAVSIGMVVHTILREWAVQCVVPFKSINRGGKSANLGVISCVTAVLLCRFLFPLPIVPTVLTVMLVSLIVFLMNRSQLQVETMFPELRRFPTLHRFISGVSS